MNMVVGAALTGTAVAGEPADPIFAAIERHRRAYKELNDNLGEDDIEAAVPEERRRSNIVAAIFGEPDWRVEGDDPRSIAHIETACRTHAENDDSAIALVSCERLTVAGAAALLEYVASVDARDPEAWPTDLFDDDDKRRTWHFFLMEQVATALKMAAA